MPRRSCKAIPAIGSFRWPCCLGGIQSSPLPRSNDARKRFPELKIVSVESGLGWLPLLLESLEYQLFEAGVPMKHSPREIFSRQIYACSWFERQQLIENARVLDVDNVMWETDFPHPTCLYPDALNYMESAVAKMNAHECRKIFGGNAQRVYNLPI